MAKTTIDSMDQNEIYTKEVTTQPIDPDRFEWMYGGNWAKLEKQIFDNWQQIFRILGDYFFEQYEKEKAKEENKFKEKTVEWNGENKENEWKETLSELLFLCSSYCDNILTALGCTWKEDPNHYAQWKQIADTIVNLDYNRKLQIFQELRWWSFNRGYTEVYNNLEELCKILSKIW